MSGATRSWVLWYQPGSVVADRQPWLALSGVPAELTGRDVLTRLEGWSRWPTWQGRVGIGAKLILRIAKQDDLDRVEKMPVYVWDDIAPREQRIIFEAPGELHAAITRIARAQGVSMSEFCRVHLTRAVEALT